MAGEIIRQGDPTDHGGTVLEGSLTDICHGKAIACMGHKVVCPKCKGTFPIIEGVLTTTFYGKGVAVAGMKTACGATLIATQFTDIIEIGGGRATAPLSGGSTYIAAVAFAHGATTLAKASEEKQKTIKAISWSYGRDKIPLNSVSRHYADLNLHVQTENYSAGEAVDITIEDDQGADVLEGVKTLTLRATVGADGRATLMNAFAGKTVITVHQATA